MTLRGASGFPTPALAPEMRGWRPLRPTLTRSTSSILALGTLAALGALVSRPRPAGEHRRGVDDHHRGGGRERGEPVPDRRQGRDRAERALRLGRLAGRREHTGGRRCRGQLRSAATGRDQGLALRACHRRGGGEDGVPPGQPCRDGARHRPDQRAIGQVRRELALVPPASTQGLSQLVGGLLDSQIAAEIAMGGPYTYGDATTVNGQRVVAIRGTQDAVSTGTKATTVFYVPVSDATGRPWRRSPTRRQRWHIRCARHVTLLAAGRDHRRDPAGASARPRLWRARRPVPAPRRRPGVEARHRLRSSLR